MTTLLMPLVRASYYASYALLAHVKPCGVHVLSPRGIDKYLSSIIAGVGFAAEAVEIGRDIAQGRLGPGNTGLGKLFFNAARAGYTSAKQLCPDTLFSQLIAAASYGYATARSTPTLSTLPTAIKTILGYLGPEDTRYFLKGLEASTANTLLTILYDEGVTHSAISAHSHDLLDVIHILSRRYGGVYTVLVNPATITGHAGILARSHTRRNIIAVWLELAKDCIPAEIRSRALQALDKLDEEPQRALKQLLELDAKCGQARHHCSVHMPELLLVSYISALVST